jgi:RNA polymerase subunit RPABC4/transcription elongation factor Spt4
MSRRERTIAQEFSVIPPVWWLVAGCWVIIYYAAILPVVLAAMQEAAPVARAAVTAAGLLDAVILLSGFYAYFDAGQRRMNRLAYTLLVVLLPFAGFLIYLLARRPQASVCPRCSAATQPGFAYCPSCGAAMRAGCPSCHQPVEAHWKYCPYCGTTPCLTTNFANTSSGS